MEKIRLPQGYDHPLLDDVAQSLSEAGITLQITQKRVKNINFRLKPYQLTVSVPLTISALQVAQAISKRVSWALNNHAQVLAQHHRRPSSTNTSSTNGLSRDSQSTTQPPIILWGVQQSFTLNNNEKIACYRQQLSSVMPALFAKWQPIVGTEAKETRIKKMHTRWGSCNTRARRIWLSVYLPTYPIECTEYVIVHELCHLHHANHSHAFWQTVETAMPEYKQWHDTLAGKTGQLD